METPRMETPRSKEFYYSSRQMGLSMEESMKIYDMWAEIYDKECPNDGYNGPQYVAMAMADYYSIEQREKINVLDVAAGTGLVGKNLAGMGFKIIDALEPCEGMLKQLRKLNVYRRVFQDTIGLGAVDPHATDKYDCLTICGGLGTGHIPVKGLDDMIRIVRPGGAVFICMLEDHLNSPLACNGELEPYMKELEDKSCWKKIRRTIVDNYTFNAPGVIFSFKVLVSTVQ